MGLLTAIKNARREHKEQKTTRLKTRQEESAVLMEVDDNDNDFWQNVVVVGYDEDDIPIVRRVK